MVAFGYCLRHRLRVALAAWEEIASPFLPEDEDVETGRATIWAHCGAPCRAKHPVDNVTQDGNFDLNPGPQGNPATRHNVKRRHEENLQLSNHGGAVDA